MVLPIFFLSLSRKYDSDLELDVSVEDNTKYNHFNNHFTNHYLNKYYIANNISLKHSSVSF